MLFAGKSNHVYGYTNLNVFNRSSLECAAKHAGLEIIFFRTEWLDVYYADLMALVEDPAGFIHKRNTHRNGYEEMIRAEDAFQASLGLDIGDRGNYLVAILRRPAG